MRNKARIKIYSGITLDESSVKRILPQAFFSRPISRGDLLGDIRERYHVICIIDGTFHHFPAVNCGEIMDAMRSGLRVYGTSSMGALRASELDVHGMIGHGAIYEHIKQSPFFRDDYLGQTFEEEAGATRRASVPYIDLFFSMKKLMEIKRITKKQFEHICQFYRNLHYTDRNLPMLFQMIDRHFSRKRELIRTLKASLARNESQKRKDAIELLQRVKSDLIQINKQNQLLNS